MSRRFMPEDRREKAQSVWFGMTRRLLTQRRGPTNLDLPLAFPQMPLCEEGVTIPAPPPKVCHHPVDLMVKGGNQHGSWKTCGLCNKQMIFKKWGPSNPRPSQRGTKKPKNVTVQTYVSTGPAAVIQRSAPALSSEERITTQDVQVLITQQTDQLAQSTAGMVSQAMGPMMETMQQMAASHQQLQTMVQGQQQLIGLLLQQRGDQMPLPTQGYQVPVEIPSGEELMEAPAGDQWEMPRN